MTTSLSVVIRLVMFSRVIVSCDKGTLKARIPNYTFA